MCRLLAVLLLLPSLAFAQGKAGTNYAFLVSCGEKYNKAQLHPLPKSFRDVDDYRKALEATGFEADNIVFLHDGTDNPLRFIPEKAKILKELKLLLASVEANDTLIVALSGHGLHFTGDKTSYFCPLDAKVGDKATMIPMDGEGGLFPILKTCKAKRKLLVVGACRNDPVKATLAAEQVDLDLLDPDEVPEGIVALYSCKAGQKSYFEAQKDRSFFYDHLVRAWQGEYHPGEDKVSLEAIFDQVKTKTSAAVRREYAEAQVPEVRREYQGEWLVSRSGARPKVEPRPAPKPVAAADDKARTFDLGNGVKLVMVRIPAKGKKFVMGSPKEEEKRDDDEDEHDVTFGHDYSMGKYEVTQEQYEAITGKNPAKFTGAKNPVETVSWDEAKAFIAELNTKFKDQKVIFRLPSEAEWEYACRGGTPTPFHFGKELNGKQANSNGKYPYGTTVEGPSLGKTTPVGGYAANDFGLHDMHGNVWEWCEDYKGPYSAAPKDGKAQAVKQSNDNDVRVLRGGSWDGVAEFCRSANRNYYAPGFRYIYIGFRVAFSPQD